MGGLISKPPSPPPLPPAPTVKDVDKEILTEDRLRRQRASGTSGNIVSSLSESKTDTESSTRISKLLG
jgi:hypothetical protein